PYASLITFLYNHTAITEIYTLSLHDALPIFTGIAYMIALTTPESIFELAVRFAFSGFAAMAPVMIAALFWKRSTKYGALASTLWVATWLVLTWYLQRISDGAAPKPGQPPVVIFQVLGHLFERSTAN